ncbi:MAG: glycoside hydrolase family 88 protein, partial [Lachnospiraceae bacterium]|nr:glycoside hydrolase family 88 protein [Lachnospiraceae bacterium]
YWAYEETKDPRYLQIATMHADTAQKYFIRGDGSSNHIVAFDPATGEFADTFGGQGYAKGSSWTRGQAWALYGFT